MNTRAPDDIRRDLFTAQLKASNVQLQVDCHYANARALQLEAEKLAGFMPQHVEAMKTLEEELRAALDERGEVTTLPGGKVIPMTAPGAAG